MAYAYANFHQEFIRNKVCLIGCPKLDQIDYTEKLTQIIANNNIKSVTIVRIVKIGKVNADGKKTKNKNYNY